jgi:LysM repeat protein
LIALLIVVVAIGGVFYLHNTSRTAARQDGASRASPVAPDLHAPQPSSNKPAPAVASAPGDPATQPAALVSITPDFRAPNTTLVQHVPSTTDPRSPHLTPATAPSRPRDPSSDSPSSPSESLTAGLAKKDAGDLLAARKLLNAALQSNELPPSDLDRCKTALREINDVLVFSPKRDPGDEYAGSHTVGSGQLLAKIAANHDITWELLCRINNMSDPRKLRAGQSIKVINGPFHAVVNKRAFTMDLYLGGAPGEKSSMFVTSFPVGLGENDSTPTGVWMVEPHKKIKNPVYYSPRGEGVIDADDPKNPLGERWIGLTGIDGQAVGKESYGIHGTIEPHTIGKQASMGCVRLSAQDVERVFEMLVEGKSTVVVTE